MNKRQAKKYAKKMQAKIDKQAVYESGDPSANDLLDIVENVEASTEILDQVEQEVDEMSEKLELVSQLNKKFEDMSVDELKEMNEQITRASVNQEMMNAPLSNEAREALAKEQAENMAKAVIASQNAQHPIKFAIGQIGACLGAIKNIPDQMRTNIDVARAAGLDCNTALENAATVITAKTTGAFYSTKDSISRNATKLAEGAADLYHSAVDNAQSSWEKGKAKMENFLHKAIKAFDIGMEAITLGGWSRLCVNAAIRADMFDENRNYKYNKQLENAERQGFKDGRKLFGVNLDDNKVVNAKESVLNFLSTAFVSLHEGMDIKEPSYEGILNFVDYFEDVKSKVWTDASDIREKASGVKGDYGVTSPMDVLCEKTRQVSDSISKAYKGANDGMQAAIKAGKEIADSTKGFFTSLPGKAKSGFSKAAGVISQGARDLAADAVVTIAKGESALLKGVSALFKKAELYDNSVARRMDDISKSYKSAIIAHKAVETIAQDNLDDINKQKIQASPQIPKELENAKNQLQAAEPTANTRKAIGIIEKAERDINNKENRRVSFHNACVVLKNAGTIAKDKVQIANCEREVSNLSKKVSELSRYSNDVRSEEKMFGKLKDDAAKKAGDVLTKGNALANTIRGGNSNGQGGGNSNGQDDNSKEDDMGMDMD